MMHRMINHKANKKHNYFTGNKLILTQQNPFKICSNSSKTT